jgi:hypothetical protein
VVNDDECPDGVMETRIQLGWSYEPIVNGQLFIKYNPESLRLMGVSPGHTCDPFSPFTWGFLQYANDSSGEASYTASVNPFSGSLGTHGPATLACLTFLRTWLDEDGVCVLEGGDLAATKISAILEGTATQIPICNADDCPEEPPAISCDEACKVIPTVSGWGLMVMALLLLSVWKICFGHGRAPPRGKMSGRRGESTA